MFKAFGWLAKLRSLRGTALDVFGYTAERKMERQLIIDYEKLIDEIVAGLDQDNYEIAVELAGLPDLIRGYGHIKERNVEAAKADEQRLLQAFRSAPEHLKAASAA
jgi:indolepyruvate ferredoxin oxidoreductase